MYAAELHGKLPSKIARSEDILTSNVFSFLKYAKRSVYLREFLLLLNIVPSEQELVEAEFLFWPNYEDGTEPDVVLLIGNYYLLFEAKYHSDFGKETATQQQQLIREIEGGMNEAKSLNREFTLIAITADYTEPKQKFARIIPQYADSIYWINWQALAQILLQRLENSYEDTQDILFAHDLYNLLAFKKLRSFRQFQKLLNIFTSKTIPETIFFSASARFRGDFWGFEKILSAQPRISPVPQSIFYIPKNIKE